MFWCEAAMPNIPTTTLQTWSKDYNKNFEKWLQKTNLRLRQANHTCPWTNAWANANASCGTATLPEIGQDVSSWAKTSFKVWLWAIAKATS